MPTPIPSPLRSAANWLKASHLRLLVSGIVAVGLIASASIFAAEDNTNKDEIWVHSPELNQPVSQDFPFRVDWKPKKGRTIWSARAYIDNHRVATWDYNKPQQPATGKAKWQYPFRWGLGGDGKANDRFNRDLLQPGTHTMRVLICSNNNPMASCLLVKQLERKFTIANNEAVTTFQEGPIAIKDLEPNKPVKGRGDGRIKRGAAATAVTSAVEKAAEQNAPDIPVRTDKVESQEETEEDDLPEDEQPKQQGAKSHDNLLSSISGTLSLTEIAYAAPRHLYVQVNPMGLASGKVWVEIQPANCSGGSKKNYHGGQLHFGPCGDTGHVAIVHPGQFRKGNQTCKAVVQSAPVNNATNLYYSCIADAVPAPPKEPPKPKPDPKPKPETSRLTVWVNPHPRLANVRVTTKGAGCGGQKTVGTDGKIEWGCRVGEWVDIKVPKTVIPPKHKNERWLVLSDERRVRLAKNENKQVNFNYSFKGIVDPGGGGTIPADAFENKKPMLALRELNCTQAKVDAYKVLSVSNASPAKTSGYLAGYTVNVDGKEVAKVDFPPGTWQSQIPLYTPAPQNWLPTYRNNVLPVGNLCDGKKHSVVLTARTLDGEASSITISEVSSPEEKPETPDDPKAKTGGLSVKTFNDKNCDGTRDEGEEALPNVKYTLKGGEDNDANVDKELNTGGTGQNTTADLQAGKYEVTVETPEGYKACGDATQTADVKEGETPELNFGLQQEEPDAPTPTPEPTDEPAGPQPPSNFIPAAPDEDIASQTAGAGSLPKTGQVGLIAFITFLLASATYYGTQYYREHKKQR